MAAIAQYETTWQMPRVRAWLPLVVLPTATMLLFDVLPPWVFMWALAVSIYSGGKWLTFAHCPEARRAPLWRAIGYLLLWPGMDAKGFFETRGPVRRPGLSEWSEALAALAVGVSLI